MKIDYLKFGLDRRLIFVDELKDLKYCKVRRVSGCKQGQFLYSQNIQMYPSRLPNQSSMKW